MNSIVALYASLVGMFGLWALAWWLWNQANASGVAGLESQKEATAVQRHPNRVARLSETPRTRRPSVPDPAAQTDAPVVRDRPSSDANTSFFSRSAIDSVAERSVDKTDLLEDDDA